MIAGPGCSSVGDGLLSELGPFRVSSSENLTLNPHSWNKGIKHSPPDLTDQKKKTHFSVLSSVGIWGFFFLKKKTIRVSIMRTPILLTPVGYGLFDGIFFFDSIRAYISCKKSLHT
jgi:hypothetical protein